MATEYLRNMLVRSLGRSYEVFVSIRVKISSSFDYKDKERGGIQKEIQKIKFYIHSERRKRRKDYQRVA
jgi:hypothetical protein